MDDQNENIDRKDMHFKGQHSNEHIECFYRDHWIVVIAPIFFYCVFVAVFCLLMFFMRTTDILEKNGILFQTIIFAVFLFATYYAHRFFVNLYNHFLNIVIITNYRIVDLDKTIILKDTKEVIDLAKIQDVIKKQDGLIRNILRFGTLTITLSSSSGEKVLHFVPNPDFHFRVINRKKREYIQQKQFDRRRASGLEGPPATNTQNYIVEGVYGD